MNDRETIWGIPIGRELTTDALLKDLWDPSTDETFPPKNFVGKGRSHLMRSVMFKNINCLQYALGLIAF